eukprot:scaffold134585_cov36-Prasinocladus_malaysianus.AAC.1
MAFSEVSLLLGVARPWRSDDLHFGIPDLNDLGVRRPDVQADALCWREMLNFELGLLSAARTVLCAFELVRCVVGSFGLLRFRRPSSRSGLDTVLSMSCFWPEHSAFSSASGFVACECEESPSGRDASRRKLFSKGEGTCCPVSLDLL